MSDRVRVALIFGGDSPEHGVSCLTAASVLTAIDKNRYEVIGVGITRSGRWTQVSHDQILGYRIVDGQVPSVADDTPDAVWLRTAAGCEVATRDGDGLRDLHGVDVAFALLHGPFGEDGTIQGLFEMMGTRYVGSGVAASANGMDKHLMKVIFESAGLPVWPYVAFDALDWRDERDRVLARIGALSYPLYVKPARGGSSLGISRVADPSGLAEAIAEAQRFDPKVIVEQGFTGAREIECAVLGDPDARQGCRTSLTGEIRVVKDGGFYDFEAKYIADDQAELDVPADLAPEVSERVQDLARRAFRAVGAEGLARVDTFVTSDGQVWLNEINTMPGFTQISMYPALWQASGLSYPGLVGRLIELALSRPLGLR
ncbi:MAG: D-alanine--D-alanine ligase family protein [Propionibacteriaceae bacterium]|nr:D-alanine--D-alanine ligase family protein [Propionibacteriaceae bacterium]